MSKGEAIAATNFGRRRGECRLFELEAILTLHSGAGGDSGGTSAKERTSRYRRTRPTHQLRIAPHAGCS